MSDGIRGLDMTATARFLDHQNPEDVERFARELHDVYERQARIMGWETQDNTSVPFDDLPEANRKTMLGVSKTIIEIYAIGTIDYEVADDA